MLSLRSLTKRYGDKLAVDQLDLEVAAGELFCFLGPNGAGKTTTIKVITGLVRPTAGSALVGGHDVVHEPLEAKALLGYIPDSPVLYDKLTIDETLRFVAGLYRLDGAWREDAEALLGVFELRDVRDRLVERLSHGMRQRLSFTVCFLHRPQVVVVDEPWVGLDPRNIRRVKDYLRRRVERDGLTILMSTHTLSLAEELADRVGIIHQGRLVTVGSVAEIKALARRPGSLEDVFLELTEGDEVAGEPFGGGAGLALHEGLGPDPDPGAGDA